jgi:hypothetical protein
MQDNMDEYTDATTMGAKGQSGVGIVPLPSPITTSQPVDTNAFKVVSPGHGGSGKAIRLAYTGAYQYAINWATNNNPRPAALATNYFSYWARVTMSKPLTSPLAVKWFEAWHSSDRIQWNTHDHLPWTGGDPNQTYWQVYDQGRGTTSQGDQPVGPYFTNIDDGQWHRFTFQYRPNTSAGSRDGFARMWVDGTKVIDISAATIGVTPPGGNKVWCNADDVDALAVNAGILYTRWGSAQTTSTPAWTYDIDDFTWWTTP